MCGRYILTAPFSEIVRLFNLTNNVNVRANYNVAPTQDVAAVRYHPDDGHRTLDTLRWGLVPFWAKDTKIGYSLINARAESIAAKPAFREAFKRRRCIIPANGFFEWQKLDAKRRQPYAIVLKDRGVFGFAGLWERWQDKASGAAVESCAIITTEPNAVCAPLHDRMPAILDPADYRAWLGEVEASPDDLRALLRPYPADRMAAYPVGAAVGNVKNNDASLLEPVAIG
jgi:putative SOS response-associated peptidase YedK